MEYYSAIKENEIMPFAATWMDLEMILLSEVNQRERYKYHMTALTCRTNKSHTKELIYKTKVDSQT